MRKSRFKEGDKVWVHEQWNRGIISICVGCGGLGRVILQRITDGITSEIQCPFCHGQKVLQCGFEKLKVREYDVLGVRRLLCGDNDRVSISLTLHPSDIEFHDPHDSSDPDYRISFYEKDVYATKEEAEAAL